MSQDEIIVDDDEDDDGNGDGDHDDDDDDDGNGACDGAAQMLYQTTILYCNEKYTFSIIYKASCVTEQLASDDTETSSNMQTNKQVG